MTILVIETATAACSVALLEDGRVLGARHEEVGRGHAERLVPMIAELLGERRPGAILVDCGPGSFTGVRVGLAAARGLALAWGVPVHGFSSLALLSIRVTRETVAALPGGHGELFVQRFVPDPLRPASDLVSLKPDAVAAFAGAAPVIGPGAALLPDAPPAERPWPRAADAALLPPALPRLAPQPLYGRAPDAKMPA